MPGTDPNIRKRVRRWYQVVQARRLRDAGYTQADTAERLGVGERTVQRWEADGELWAAAAVAPDREAVGPSKRAPWRPLEVLADAVDAAERATASPPSPPQKPHPSGVAERPDESRSVSTSGIERDNSHDASDDDAPGGSDDDEHAPTSRADDDDGSGAPGDDAGAPATTPGATTPTTTPTTQRHDDGDDETTRHGDTPRGRHDETGRHPPRRSEPQPARGTNTPGSQVARPSDERRARYAGLGDTATGKAYDTHRRDPDPLDTLPELDLLRAATETYIRHCEELPPCGECGAGFPPNPATLGDLADKISKAAERVLKIRQADAIPRGQFLQFMGDLGRSIRRHCTEEQAAAISDDVLSFRPQ